MTVWHLSMRIESKRRSVLKAFNVNWQILDLVNDRQYFCLNQFLSSLHLFFFHILLLPPFLLQKLRSPISGVRLTADFNSLRFYIRLHFHKNWQDSFNHSIIQSFNTLFFWFGNSFIHLFIRSSYKTSRTMMRPNKWIKWMMK